MRILLIICLAVTQSGYAQFKAGTYYSKPGLLIGTNASVITIKNDGTFLYQPGLNINQPCLTNQGIKGSWVIDMDKLVLIDSIEHRVSAVEAAFQKFETRTVKRIYKISYFKKSLTFIKQVNEADNSESTLNLWGDFKM